jgi:hypothetical protein
MGIGHKITDGEVTDRLALRVYVSQKRPSAQLTAHEAIPGTITFIPQKETARRRLYTDVIETPPAVFQQVDPETRIRPVPGGVSGGISGHTGTIGGWVWDLTDDSIVMLSNEHVFQHTAGVDILQQGTADGGTLPADKIGDVKRGIARIPSILAVHPNYVDCAIGDPDSADIYDLTVLEIGPAVYAIAVPLGDMLVEKYGQTTEHTFGQITDADWEGWVANVYYYDDCIRVEPVAPSAIWSDSGDSGSLVFSQTPIGEDSEIKPVVGLHFAGNGYSGVACKIHNVFENLNLTTLCDGAFSSVSDSLFGLELEGEEAEAQLQARAALASRTATQFSPRSFVRKERGKLRERRFHAGISRDMQKRLRISERGRAITDFVDQNRSELLTRFAKDGDVRRATVAAIRPLVAGATTTTEVLERTVSAEDLERLDRLSRELLRKGSPRLQKAVRRLMALRPKTRGVSLAQALEIEP